MYVIIPVLLSYAKLPSPPESVTLIALLALAFVKYKLVGLPSSAMSSVTNVILLSTFALLLLTSKVLLLA